MKFGVFTHAEHVLKNEKYYSYGPYVKEMNIWIGNFDDVLVMAPLLRRSPNNIDLPYDHAQISFNEIPSFHFKKENILSSIKKSILIFRRCILLMKKCDHLHIRCPGNIGFIALLASVFFPGKPKTIKYAGNWDFRSKQPLSYNIQKRLLQNTWLIQNKKVLIYGKWSNQPDHIVSFFTASFSDIDRTKIDKAIDNHWNFIYCGALVPGKNPFYAINIIHELLNEGHSVYLDIYGDGIEKEKLKNYIIKHDLSVRITVHGNQPQALLRQAYKRSHFCILPSKSEGWPKAIAEGMFYGCVPIATKISCIPWMLAYGKRGIIIDENLSNTTDRIRGIINSEEQYHDMSQKAMKWSRKYTLEKFEKAIAEIL